MEFIIRVFLTGIAYLTIWYLLGANKDPGALLTAGAVLLILMILKWIF